MRRGSALAPAGDGSLGPNRLAALASLWAVFACAAHRNETAPTSIRLPEVRAELLAMADEDQRARFAAIAEATRNSGSNDQLRTMAQIDDKNTARLKSLVAEHGWLGKSLVGEDGAHAGWLLVQHAGDRAFQKECLEKMKSALKDGEVSATDFAYLFDRVAMFDGRKQLYGTQFRTPPGTFCEMEPVPIEDEEHVDERRKALGLPPMVENAKQLRETYKCKP